MSFLAELRRRNVIRMAGLYLITAWLLVQIAETLLPIFDTPGWVLKALVVLVALGFVPALVFSWVFELTPEGLKRDAEVTPGQSIAPQTGRRMDRLIVAGLVLVVAVVAADRYWPREIPGSKPVSKPGSEYSFAPDAAEAGGRSSAKLYSDPGFDTGFSRGLPASSVPAVADKSIAVLPFADFSAGGDQAWFADGLTEEILNALARTPDLLVSARTSSFRYKGSELAIPQIAQELGVAHVLEGSVRSTPQRIRVTAQLIRATDGFHLWSQTYDRELADVIAIQEELAKAIATAMETRMDPQALAGMARVGTRSVEAYQAYLRGVAELAALEGVRAHEQFELARKLDPGFADAHAGAATMFLNALDSTSMASQVMRRPSAELEAEFATRIALAIEHAPDDISRLGFRAMQAEGAQRWREAVALYQQYLAERPGDTRAIVAQVGLLSQMSEPERLGELLDAIWPQAQVSVYMATLHADNSHRTLEFDRAADQALALAERWAGEAMVSYQAHRALLWAGRTDQAAQILRRWQAMVDKDASWGPLPAARQACAEGRRADVEQLLAQMADGDPTVRWHLLHLLGREAEAVATLHAMIESSGSPRGLNGFLSYPDFDPAPFPVLLQLLDREQVQRPPPVPLPFACPPPGAPG